MKYKGYSICNNYKTVYYTNKRSGHTWSEHVIKKGFHIIGLGVFSNQSFSSIKTAKKHIDYLLRNNLNKTYYHVTRKTHPQFYKEII